VKREEHKKEKHKEALGSNIPATTKRTSVEKSNKEINMVTKKNRVFKPLKTLFDLSSFEKPISI
jgi:hypothetical protein